MRPSPSAKANAVGLLHFWNIHLSGQNVRFLTSHDGASCGELISKMAETVYTRYYCPHALSACPRVRLAPVSIDSRFHSRNRLTASLPQKVTALTAAGEPDIARSARRTACSKALGRAAQHIRRPTRAHPLHLRSTLLHFTCARNATHSSAGVCLVEQPAVTFLPTEHRNHRQVPPADCQCNATCTINPCAKRQRRLCHGGAPRCLLAPKEPLGAL